jgi:tyrosyl-tRNA synthetase
VGRDIQREFGQEPQVTLMMPILAGTDGVEKMSKSLDNYIGVSDTPKDIYGKTLSIPDKLIYQYFELATDVPTKELLEIKKSLDNPKINPRDTKRTLARTFVRMYHSQEAATGAEEEFDRIFVEKSIPDDIEEFTVTVPMTITTLMADTKLATSKGEARRLVDQGGVSIDGERVSDPNILLPNKSEFILKVGKRRFLKVKR